MKQKITTTLFTIQPNRVSGYIIFTLICKLLRGCRYIVTQNIFRNIRKHRTSPPQRGTQQSCRQLCKERAIKTPQCSFHVQLNTNTKAKCHLSNKPEDDLLYSLVFQWCYTKTQSLLGKHRTRCPDVGQTNRRLFMLHVRWPSRSIAIFRRRNLTLNRVRTNPTSENN